MKKILMLYGVLLFISSSLFGQQVTVTGTVTDGMDGSTLPGVSIQVKGTATGTVTDARGRYELNVASDATLVFSFLGMVPEEINVGGRSIIDVALLPDIAALDEVIVVAYGTARRGSFTGAATQLTAEKIENRPITNVARAIEGQSAGIQVSAGSGQPGAGQAIRIRGFGSINASSDPLYVVDGVPYALGIDNLNPADIESISVLKDASATALYGNRAANGVIMITTKRGTADRPQFQVRATRGFSNRAIPEYERLGPNQWMEMAWESYRNQLHYGSGEVELATANQRATDELVGLVGYNAYNVDDNQIVNPDGSINPNASLIYSAADLSWEDELTRLGDRSEVNMNFSGGSGPTDYFVSLGYLNDQGYVIESDYERISARLNVNSEVTDWFNTGLNISGSSVGAQNARVESSTGFVNPFFFARNIGPIYPVYAQEPGTGNYILDENGQKIYDLGGMGELGLPNRPAGASPGRHILAETLWNQDEFKRNTLSARTFGEVSFLNNFKFRVNAAIDFNNYLASSFDNPTVGDGSPAGRAEKVNTTTTAVTLNQLLTYNRVIGAHSFDVLLGHENYDWNYDYARGFKQGIILEGNTQLINFTTINQSTSYAYRYRTEGYFTGLNYGFEDRFFGSATFRRDGSSRFYEDSRWGNFWSVGAAWRLDRENFIRDLGWVNMLMLRTSYGQVGNDDLDSYYPWHALYGIHNNANEPGFRQSSLPAYDLVWESNNSYSLGLEFGIFRRIRGNVDFFHRVSDNLLFAVPLPISTGVLDRDENIGTMYNQGVELRVAVDVLADTDFRWTVDLNATTFKNQITKMPFGEEDEIIVGTKKYMEGRSIYDYWLRQWYGVDPEDGRGLYYAENTGAANVRVIGTDTLTTAAANAKYDYAGTAIPDLVGGITNTFSYGNMELSVLLTYQLGGKVYDGSYGNLMAYGSWGSAMHADLLNRWTPENTNTDVPRLNQAEVNDAYAASTRWLTNASYLNVRSVNFSYNLPTSVSDRIFTQNVRVFASAENLFLFSHRKGMNVQQGFAGVTSNVYTPARSVTFGVNVSF